MNNTKKTEWKVDPDLASHEYLDLGLVRLEVRPSLVWLDNSPKSWRVELWAVNGGGEYDDVDMRITDLCAGQTTIEAAKALGIARAKAILTESLKALESVE